MTFDDLFEKQPRWAEVLAGIAATVCGLFALVFAVWLYRHDVLSGRNIAARPIALFTVLIGLYALVIARRLLAPPEGRPKYLFSTPTLVVIGILLAVGGLVPALFSREAWPQAAEGLALGGACIVLAFRRWRAGG
jgi:amino acid transporter